MAFKDIRWGEVEFDNMGEWQIELKGLFAAGVFAAVIGAAYYFFIGDKLDQLSASQNNEIKLREEYSSKYRLAANLPLYREQFKELQERFSGLMRMLPTENEMPGLIDDVTFAATSSGLKIEQISWSDEVAKDFYYEYPISITVNGNYHQLGEFVASVAKLPRIVSLHDFNVSQSKDNNLNIKLAAKTYRFRDEQKNNKNNKGKR